MIRSAGEIPSVSASAFVMNELASVLPASLKDSARLLTYARGAIAIEAAALAASIWKSEI